MILTCLWIVERRRRKSSSLLLAAWRGITIMEMWAVVVGRFRVTTLRLASKWLL